jgi:uncharacterized protein DUF6174
MHRIVRLAPVLALTLFVACSDSTGPFSLAMNRQRWERQNLHNYAYTGFISCFCNFPPEEVLVTVIHDAVTSVSLQSTGAEVSKEGWQTVDQLFDYAERAIADKNNHVTVEYDRKLGYPTEISVSCPAADCGSYVRVRRLNEIIID